MDDDIPATQGLEDFDVDAISQYENVACTQSELWGELWLQRLIKKTLGHQRATIFQNTESGRYYKLFGPSFKVGRDSSSDFKLSEITVTQQILSRISKVQFEIKKDISNFIASPVVITDLSSNGTYVNEELVGKGKSRILMHGDKISMVNERLVFFEFRDKTERRELLPKSLSKKYFPEHEVGIGAFGHVFKAKSIKTFETFALKMISSSKDMHTNPLTVAVNEATIMKDIKHPCIVRLIELIPDTTEAKQTYTLVLEYMEGGDLLHRVIDSELKRMPEDESRCIFFQLANAVQYLHTKNITHRDIKPENVLLKDNSQRPLVKLTDFGLSKIIHKNSLLKSLLGTPCYVAPEVLTTNEMGAYDSRVDIWGLGVVLFAMLSGSLPFAEEYGGTVESQIKAGRYRFASVCWDTTSHAVKRLIVGMLQVNPSERISIRALLSSEWLSRKHPDLLRTKKMMDAEAEIINKEDENNISQLSKRIRRI